ncbi:hypothetical protein Tco_1470585, partial [Tanacetum coccineum]
MGNSLDNLSRATQVGTDKEHPGYYSRNDNMSSSGDRRASLEKALKKFVDESTKRNVAIDEMLMKYDAKTKAAMKNHASSIKNLENQIDQLARAVEATLDGASIGEFVDYRLLNSTTSTILEGLPRKREDPGSLYIPLSIYTIENANAFADLGASINVMLLLIFKRLGLDDMKEIKIDVEVAKRCLMKPLGIAENILVE